MTTIGTDPEFMLEKNDKIFSAINILKKSKDNRKKIQKCFFYYDNVLAECTVIPADNKESFLINVKNSLELYSNLVKPYNLRTISAHIFDVDQLNCPEAFEISCVPEICAYSLDEITTDPSVFLESNLRTAGGHIHIGDKHLVNNEYNPFYCIKMMDLFLGTISLFLDKDPTALQRKQLYGKAGRFRSTKYGVEYRSLGNFWLNSPELAGLIFDVSCFVSNFIREQKHFEYWSIDYEKLKDPNSWKDRNFNSKDCHFCFGYDSNRLIELINLHDNKSDDALKFLKFICDILPKNIVNDLNLLMNKEYDDNIIKNWGINVK